MSESMQVVPLEETRHLPPSLVEIAPFVSCVCNVADFEAAKACGYQIIFLPYANGTWLKHVALSGDRYVRITVKDLPKGVEFTRPPEVIPGMNFLPAGKIPRVILNQLIQFFKDVMTKLGGDDEAMAHVLWNEAEGYHIAIPNQRVSKASVSFESDHIKPGDMVVLDIHSHNTMGEYFSLL